MRPLVSVSVVTGRSADDLRRALDSLRRAAVETPCRVVVIDNKAPFDAASDAPTGGPPIEILRNDRRRGFGDNHNQALSRLETPYALVMNDDVELGDGCVDRMADFMERTPDAGAAGCALHGGGWSRPPTEGGGVVTDAGSPALKLLLAMAARRLDLPVWPEDLARWRDGGRPAPERPLPLDYISGACCLLRARALQAAGLYDTGFYMYLEDVDLGLRLRRAGWRCYQVPGARALHRAGRSWSPRTPRWMWASALRYADKYGEPSTRLAARLLEPFAGPRSSSR
jgi:N-acetylglucosaminyl-diphospho-decaprenol L-rhamnosyltransferase